MYHLAPAPRYVGAVAFVSTVLIAIAAPACGGTSAHCGSYCDRWHECVDSTVDIDGCKDACVDWADGNSDRESKVNECDECLGQNDTCSDAGRRCAVDCLGIPFR